MPFGHRLPLLLLFALGQWLHAPTARAVPLLEGDTHTLNIDGSFKSFFVGMSFSSHDAAMRRLLGLNGESRGGMAIADIRIKVEGEHGERWKWQLHYRLQPALTSFAGATSAFGFSSAARPSRFLPLQGDVFNDPTSWMIQELDRINVRLRLGSRLEITLGRQPVTFGVGFVWMPADLVGTFSPLELDREYKPGVDALRVNLALGDFTELALVGALGGPVCVGGKFSDGSDCDVLDVRVRAVHSLALMRFRTSLGGWDVGLLGGFVRGDVVVGSFATGSAGRLRFRAEATLTHDLEVDRPTVDGRLYAGSGNADGETETFVRAVVGADYTFDTERPWSLFAELYFNGFGTRDPERYLEIARAPRVSELGEVFNLGLLYGAVGINGELHEKVPVSMVLMLNAFDPSVQLSATVGYKVGDESDLVFGLQIPIGQAPQLEGSSMLMNSEFGLYPQIYYLLWRAYF